MIVIKSSTQQIFQLSIAEGIASGTFHSVDVANCRYGVGQIYFRQEKYEMAEYHFRRSLLINQRSSVLRCYVGVALHKIGRAQDALDQLQVCTQSQSATQTPVTAACMDQGPVCVHVCLWFGTSTGQTSLAPK